MNKNSMQTSKHVKNHVLTLTCTCIRHILLLQ